MNIGCGQTATPGWINFDNSPAVLLARLPLPLVTFLHKIRLLSAMTVGFVEYCRAHKIRHASALAIPEKSGSVDVLYSSHMFEHLDREEAKLFLAECRRVLKPEGILRLVVPDLKKRIEYYYGFEHDGDRLLESCIFELEKPRGFRNRLVRAITGGREHHWMYDYASLSRLIENSGFSGSRDLLPGETTIAAPGALDLREQEATWSIYLEARCVPQAPTL